LLNKVVPSEFIELLESNIENLAKRVEKELKDVFKDKTFNNLENETN